MQHCWGAALPAISMHRSHTFFLLHHQIDFPIYTFCVFENLHKNPIERRMEKCWWSWWISINSGLHTRHNTHIQQNGQRRQMNELELKTSRIENKKNLPSHATNKHQFNKLLRLMRASPIRFGVCLFWSHGRWLWIRNIKYYGSPSAMLIFIHIFHSSSLR